MGFYDTCGIKIKGIESEESHFIHDTVIYTFLSPTDHVTFRMQAWPGNSAVGKLPPHPASVLPDTEKG